MMDIFAGFMLGVGVTSLFAMAIFVVGQNAMARAFEAGKSHGQVDRDPADYWKLGSENEED